VTIYHTVKGSRREFKSAHARWPPGPGIRCGSTFRATISSSPPMRRRSLTPTIARSRGPAPQESGQGRTA
jgi:hypothetical protein